MSSVFLLVGDHHTVILLLCSARAIFSIAKRLISGNLFDLNKSDNVFLGLII